MYLTEKQVSHSLSVVDLTDPTHHHAISILLALITKAISERYKISPEIHRGERIVRKEDNFYSLGYSDKEITLSTKYTRYVDSEKIFRTQMTSVIPNLLRNFDSTTSSRLWVCPGIVFRRDVVDRTHVGEPHQCDIWFLTKEKKMGRQDLLDLVSTIVDTVGKCITGSKLEWRYNETSHHYTDDGIEVEILYKDKWLEILECGLAGRRLLSSHNIGEEYSGLALGMGLDRLVMLVKDIEDIRVLRDPNPRVKRQMENLSPYRRVSKQPPIKRDLSICLPSSETIEELTEKILTKLGEDQSLVEEISLISCTPKEQLPKVAQERLGILDGQDNWLIRIILRHPSQSITNEKANSLYTLIYEDIHKGSKGYKIS